MISNFSRRMFFGVSSAALLCNFVMPRIARAQAGVATTLVPSVESFSRPAAIQHIALSPDGKRVASVMRDGSVVDDGGKKVLVIFTIGQEAQTRVSLGADKVRDVFWGDNDHVILVDSSTEHLERFASQKQELYAAQSIDATTGDVKVFFTNQPDIAASTGSMIGRATTNGFYRIVFGPIKRIKVDGQYRVTASNFHLSNDAELCLFNFKMNSTIGELMTKGSNDTEDFVVTPDGGVVAMSVFEELTKEWSLAFNSALAQKKQKFSVVYRTKGEVLNRPTLIGLGRDGNSVIIHVRQGDKDDGTYHEISATGVLSEPLNPKTAGVHFPLFHPTTFRLAGFGRVDDKRIFDWFDPGMKAIEDALPKVLGEDYRISVESYAEDPRKLIAYIEGADDAGSYYFIDLTTGDGSMLGADYPDIPVEWITQKQAISYPAADGLTIPGYLTLPPFKAATNLPLIVLPHGGPEARDFVDFDWQTQVLASRGYAVLQPNFRGSDGYGQDFVAAGHGQWGRKMQTDLSDGVRYLVSKGMVDPKRVAILGASYGGYAAMAGATLDQGVYNCSVAIAGVSDLEDLVQWEDNKTGNDNGTGVQYWKRFMGDKAGWADVSPARQAGKAYCPLLLIHGTDDTVVPISQSQRMESAMKSAGKSVELITYKGQDHWETVGPARVQMMKDALTFLAKHNPA